MAKPTTLADEATYLCDTVKPQMAALRAAVDKAEAIMDSSVHLGQTGGKSMEMSRFPA